MFPIIFNKGKIIIGMTKNLTCLSTYSFFYRTSGTYSSHIYISVKPTNPRVIFERRCWQSSTLIASEPRWTHPSPPRIHVRPEILGAGAYPGVTVCGIGKLQTLCLRLPHLATVIAIHQDFGLSPCSGGGGLFYNWKAIAKSVFENSTRTSTRAVSIVRWMPILGLRRVLLHLLLASRSPPLLFVFFAVYLPFWFGSDILE